MAKTNKSLANFVTFGYGQVEPNHLSAQRTGQIYAQLPIAAPITVVENGQFVKYDYANEKVNLTGPGEWMLVFNEVKVYDVRETAADYVMDAANFGIYSYGIGGTASHQDLLHDDTGHLGKGDAYPRVFKTNVGDIFTTNLINVSVDEDDKIVTPVVGQFAIVDTGTGILKNFTLDNDEKPVLITTLPSTGMAWQIVKVYTLPDNQKAVKVMRVQ